MGQAGKPAIFDNPPRCQDKTDMVRHAHHCPGPSEILGVNSGLRPSEGILVEGLPL